LLLAPEGERFIAETLAGWDPSVWPPGVGTVPAPRRQPGGHPAAPAESAAMGYASAEEEENAAEEPSAPLRRLRLDTNAESAAEESGAGAWKGVAGAWRELAAQQQPTRVVLLADVDAEYCLCTALSELPPAALPPAMPPCDALPWRTLRRGGCASSDALASAAAAALFAARQFGPAATLLAAWHDPEVTPGRRAAALASVAAALASHAALRQSAEAVGEAWLPPPPRSALGDALGRAQGGAWGAEAAWASLAVLLASHDDACAGSLRLAASDAALEAAPGAALPPFLRHAFTAGREATGGGMAGRGGADPAALLRLYLTPRPTATGDRLVQAAALSDAAALACAELARWAEAPVLRRAAPMGSWFAYGAMEALTKALTEATEPSAEAALSRLQTALVAHAARVAADAAAMAAVS